MKTGKRISKIAEAVGFLTQNLEGDLVVADIATDHGFIAESLTLNTKIKEVIATDISEKSLQKAIDRVKYKNLKNIQTALGDGLDAIEKTDISVIAGIGGYEIINMLSNQNKTKDGSFKCRYFVLQPAQNEVEFRKYLFKNRIFVVKDYVIEDAKRFYPIIIIDVFKKQKNKMNVFNLRLGRDSNTNDLDFINYLKMLEIQLEFLKNIKFIKLIKDKDLRQKYKLYLLVEKLLKK